MKGNEISILRWPALEQRRDYRPNRNEIMRTANFGKVSMVPPYLDLIIKLTLFIDYNKSFLEFPKAKAIAISGTSTGFTSQHARL